MTDREKVIKGCELVKEFIGDGLPGNMVVFNSYINILNDAIALLKEQEAVVPIPPADESDLWKCGNCNHRLFCCTHQRYCEMCGKPVKWK